jgi:hypothetical protein
VIDMRAVSDNDLILFHDRDGLDAARLAEIETAISGSGDLRLRYERLRNLLACVQEPPPEPAAGFEQRLWERLETRIAHASAPRLPAIARLRNLVQIAFPPRALPRLAWAAGLAAILLVVAGVGFLAGRGSAPVPMAGAPGDAPTMASRVLDSYVAGHLRATEGLLLTAVNDERGTLLAGNRELAAGLVESNRLYAAAADRAGNARLADFLRQLEPVLIELANQPASDSIETLQGLRGYLRDTDLLFQVRATESRIDADRQRSL